MGAGHTTGSPYYWRLKREAEEKTREAREAEAARTTGEDKEERKTQHKVALVLPQQDYRETSNEKPAEENKKNYANISFFEANGWTEEENQQLQLGGNFLEENGWDESNQQQQIEGNFFVDHGWEREESYE